jgi:hypothetical protein
VSKQQQQQQQQQQHLLQWAGHACAPGL